MRLFRNTTLYWLISVVVWSCADTPSAVSESESSALTIPGLWQDVLAEHDPFVSHRPADVECAVGGAVVEDGILEVDTGRCNYFAASQPLRRDLNLEQTVFLTLYHDDLFSVDGGSAHIALMIDDVLLWETDISIPSESRLFTIQIPLESAYFEGDRVYFHLHNHGVNHWRLVSLIAGASESTESSEPSEPICTHDCAP